MPQWFCIKAAKLISSWLLVAGCWLLVKYGGDNVMQDKGTHSQEKNYTDMMRRGPETETHDPQKFMQLFVHQKDEWCNMVYCFYSSGCG